MIRLYLAGPEVFHPSATAIGAAKVQACARFGFAGLFPLDGGEPGAMPADAMAIYRRCVALMHEADAGIFNLTPFRGPSADVGTVLELGVMAALGKPVFAYTHAAEDLIDRLRADPGLAFDEPAGLWRDPDGMSAEDFGLADNLMLDGTLAGQGRGVHRLAIPAGERFTRLDGFLACLDEARAAFAHDMNERP